MRSISQLSLQKIAQTDGLEPINFIEVNWGGRSVLRYSDQKTPELAGKILELTDLENVVNISGHASSQSINVKLDDVDGSIKNIINNVDIHKSNVKVYQWFKGIPLADAFIVFEGEITSPIVWSEGDRTLSFSVVSKLEDIEVGFSAEEGDFEYIPPEIIGKAWPLTFGSPVKVPAIRVDKIPTGALANVTAIGVANINNEHYFKLVENNSAALAKSRQLATESFILALQAYNTASAYAFDQTVENINAQAIVDNGGTVRNFTSLIDQYNSIGDQYTDKGNDYLAQVQEIIRTGVLVFEEVDNGPPNDPLVQASRTGSVAVASGFNFPQGTSVGVNIGGAQHVGQFDGTNFTITSRENPLKRLGIEGAGPINVADQPVSTKYQQDLSLQNIWIGQPGSLVTISETFNYPINYIAALNFVTVTQVYAYRNLNGLRQIYPLPPNYYTIQHKNFATLNATFVQLVRPLSAYRDEGWEDEIFCDITSGVGSNLADVLSYIISVWTNHDVDAVSFNHIRIVTTNYPCDFALTKRENVIKVLQDIAFQARCAIWYSNGKFYLKYLPEVGEVVDVIREADIEAGTMELTCTETENIVTKFSATWQPDGASDPYTLIFRHNILKYGVLEDSFEFYIYKYLQLVEKSSVFWMIRRSNTWKLLKFSTFLTKLNLETYDMVLLDLSRNYVSNGPVTCMVDSCKYNSADNRVDITLWVPIRFGEMTEYPFAMPAAVDETIVFPQAQDVVASSPASEGAGGRLTSNNGGNFTRPKPTLGANRAHGGVANPGYYNPEPSDLRDTPPTSGGTFIQPFIDPKLTIGDRTTRTHRQWNIKPLTVLSAQQDTPGVFPGRVVVHNEGDSYQVNVFLKGISGEPTVVTAKRLTSGTETALEPDTPVTVVKNVWYETTGPDFDPVTQLKIEYTLGSAQGGEGTVFPGIVRSQSNGLIYNVDIYKNGLNGVSESVEVQQQGDLAVDEVIPEGVPVQVLKSSWTDDQGNLHTEYTMNVPTWLEPQED